MRHTTVGPTREQPTPHGLGGPGTLLLARLSRNSLKELGGERT